MSSMFANALPVVRRVVSGRKKSRDEIVLAGLQRYALIDAAIGSLSAERSVLEYELKKTMMASFIERGLATKKRPANFVGIEGEASASCELRRRGSRSFLDEETRMLLTAAGVGVEVVEDVVDTYVINPAYLGNSKLLERVSKALSKIASLPEDFIQHQVAVPRYIVAEEALAQVFAGDRLAIETLLPVVAVPALKVKLGEGARAKLAAFVATIIGRVNDSLRKT